jgi:hypothetical protein
LTNAGTPSNKREFVNREIIHQTRKKLRKSFLRR